MEKKSLSETWIYRFSHCPHRQPTAFFQRQSKRNAQVQQTIQQGHQQIRAVGRLPREAHSSSSYTAYTLPSQVTACFADEVHRLHHLVWHLIRNHWHHLRPSEAQRLSALDWHVWGDRAAMGPDALLNGSGEDFLFFHRQMIKEYLQLMRQTNTKPIWWEEIPPPGEDRLGNKVPPPWPIPSDRILERRIAAVKSDSFYWERLKWIEHQFRNPHYLATLTLGELGSLLEFTIHNDLHMRWSAPPRDPLTNELIPAGRPMQSLSHKWTLPAYDWLGEFYSAQVNPLFWRLHGWIDARVEDWYRAHEMKHPGQITRTIKGGVLWFEPGRWVQVEHPWVWPSSLGGYYRSEHSPRLHAKRLASLRKVAPFITRLDQMQNQHYF